MGLVDGAAADALPRRRLVTSAAAAGDWEESAPSAPSSPAAVASAAMTSRAAFCGLLKPPSHRFTVAKETPSLSASRSWVRFSLARMDLRVAVRAVASVMFASIAISHSSVKRIPAAHLLKRIGPSPTARLLQLRSEGLLEESISASWLDRRWPKSGPAAEAWSLQSLRKAFLDGSLTRLVDQDKVLKAKIPECVERGELGLASGQQPDGSFARVWFEEPVSADDVTFESDLFLLRKARARELKATPVPGRPAPTPDPTPTDPLPGPVRPRPPTDPARQHRTLTLDGSLTPEVWNRVGTELLPKLRSGSNLQISVRFQVDLHDDLHVMLRSDLEQILRDLGIEKSLRIER